MPQGLLEMLMGRNAQQQATAGAGLPQNQMTPQERAIFTKDTGIAPNPQARDIRLNPEQMLLEELLKRAAAIPGG